MGLLLLYEEAPKRVLPLFPPSEDIAGRWSETSQKEMSDQNSAMLAP